MATRMNSSGGWGASVRDGAARGGARIGGALLILLSLLLAIALASYDSGDAALNTASGAVTANWMGPPGAIAADALLTLFGPAAALLLPVLLVIGVRSLRLDDRGRPGRALALATAAVVLIGVALGVARSGMPSALPAGWGGVFGIAGTWGLDLALSPLRGGAWATPAAIGTAAVFAGLGVTLWLVALGLRGHEREWLRGLFARMPGREAGADSYPIKLLRGPDRARPEAAQPEADFSAGSGPTRTVIADRVPAPDRKRPAKDSPRDKQASLALGDAWTLPKLDLLAPAPPASKFVVDKASLERNARLLESVLDDFHVKGQIVEVRPGPVVTMYELEPASGIKASRVIQLADDIARNMSALSARVATIPGRSVIGIELPNKNREGVVLSELVASDAFEDQIAQLPIILGKNIAGDPVVADLAPMPHLLVAGTTGSGKSVGLNCMILSLLYRLTPEQCKMIMIDPKMLELSSYDDIPHLLAPVVTEPAKAIRALKWTVEQMEERYRMMASVGVRALASFNTKVREAKAKGEPLGRRVQTGYNADTGQPTYEEEVLEYDVLPQIVVIVDELADLMMTAGKEVEFLIQRLAQKARAAGIHLIMATQRPSVDVITGVIKANLPTRISFQVTSKIDSRTILGEQGAEQLLGKGDMLYMPGGKQIARVHGPFVSDDEVRAVADHWRAQATPDYIQAVTEEPEEGDAYEIEGSPDGPDDPETALYRKALQVVAESQKASTSYVQRQLRVGYNNAARLIERMEKEGKVGKPDHVGRREVLMDTDGHPL